MEQSSKPPGSVEFLISNLSLPMSYVVARNLHDHEKYVEHTGADGLEITPMYFSRFINRLIYRSMVLEEEIAVDLQDEGRERLARVEDTSPIPSFSPEDEAYQNLVRSGHSSFRNSSGDNGLVALGFPPWEQSLDMLDKVQVITGGLSVVLYPNFEDGNVIYSKDNAPFAERTFQPKASDWKRMGLSEFSNIATIREVIGLRGYDSLTFDLFHSQVEEDGEYFRDPVGLASRLALGGLINSVHLSVNRLDITGRHSNLADSTRAAKRSFVHTANAAGRTIEGEMLSEIGSIWKQNDPTGIGYPKRVVIEEGPLRSGNTKRNHAAIIAHARELIDQS